jgi:hypothetical protein
MEIDIEKLKAELKAQIIHEITMKDLKTSNKDITIWDKTREKYKKPLREKFGGNTYYVLWESIRRTSCLICGIRYVRDMSPILEEKAAIVAAHLCEMALEDR